MAWINGQWADEDELQGMLYQNSLSSSPSMLGSITPTVGGYDRGPDAGWGLSRFPNLFTGLDTIVGDQNITPGYNPVADASIINESIQSSPYDPVALNKALSKPSFTGPLNELNQQATGNFTGMPSVFGTGTQVAGGDSSVFSDTNWRDTAIAEAQRVYDASSGTMSDEMDQIDAWKDVTPGYSLSATLRDIVQPSGYTPFPSASYEDYMETEVPTATTEGTAPDYSQMAQDWGDPTIMSPADINAAMGQKSNPFGGLKGILGTNIPFTNSQIGDIVNLDPTETGGYIDKQGTIEKMVRLGLMSANQANQAKQAAWQADESTNFAQMLAQMVGTSIGAIPLQMWDDGPKAGLKAGAYNMLGVGGGYGGSQMDAMIEMMAKGDKTVEEVAEVLPTLAAMDISTNPTKGSRTLDGETIDKAYTSFDDIATVPVVAPTVPAYSGPTQAEINAAKRATDLENQKSAARAKAAADRLAALRAKQTAADEARQVQDAIDRQTQKDAARALIDRAASSDHSPYSEAEVNAAIEVLGEIDTFASGNPFEARQNAGPAAGYGGYRGDPVGRESAIGSRGGGGGRAGGRGR